MSTTVAERTGARDLRIPDHIAEILVDGRAYADERLHQALTWLRANQPLGRVELEGFTPFWAITRHADILDVSRRNDTFHNGDVASVLTTTAQNERTKAITGGSPHLVRSLVSMDAPDHPKYRTLTQAWFMPPNLRTIERDIAGLAAETAERMAAMGGACDFVTDVALHYPLHVIMRLFGVPAEDEPLMLRLTQELFGPTDPDVAKALETLTPEQMGQLIYATVAEFNTYFAKLTADRRASPRDDLATVIANAVIDGRPINDVEANGYYTIIATAGHDTTSSTSAGAMWALATQPGLLARIKADRSLIPGLIDEAIRWTTPVKHFMRSATEDTEIAGQPIAKGDWMMLCYASGNRDEAVFDAPFEFRADRKPNRHLAFGYGAHLCLGQHLAKMELRLLLEALIDRLDSVELTGEPKYSVSTFVNGLKTLPIRYAMR